MRFRSHLREAGALGLVALAVGCSGPTAPLDVGTQTVPLSLVLGELKSVDDAPVGPVAGPPVPSSRPYYEPPTLVPVDPPDLAPPPNPCPDFDPLAPVLGVGRAVTAPPVKATYRYGVPLFLEMEPGKRASFAGDSTWTVEPQPVDPATGAYDVVYTVKYGENVTKRVLRTLPRDLRAEEGAEPSDATNPNTSTAITTANVVLRGQGVAPLPTSLPNLAGYGLAGIYLVSTESSAGTAFRPAVPLALLQFRQLSGATDTTAQRASAITSVGFDPVSQAVMAFRSTVVRPTHTVNACGTKLESVQVELSSPNPPDVPLPQPPAGPDARAALYVEKAPQRDAASPRANVVLFGEKLDFGLQYGGLLLQDQLAVAPLSGVQVDPLDPPATPSGSPPSDPKALVTWAGSPALAYAAEHMLLKQATFTISEKPKVPKSSAE